MGFHDSSARMCPASSATMSPDRCQERNAPTFPVSNATTFQDSSVTTFLASSASRCPSRSVMPPSQLTEMESKEENFLLITSLSPPPPTIPLHTSVDFENTLVNSILCHFHPISIIFICRHYLSIT